MRAKLIIQSIAVALITVSALWTTTTVAAEVGPASRVEATRILADIRRIVTDNGVERLEKTPIGGIDQWISIRGTDRRNPILLMLHGGPGYVSMPGPPPSTMCSATAPNSNRGTSFATPLSAAVRNSARGSISPR